MNDDALKEALYRLYAYDCQGVSSAGVPEPLRASCRKTIWDRLVDDRGDFRIWISGLVRDMYLTDEALADGKGIDEACEFWSWFDQTMWSSAPRLAPAAG